jgi:hypothetical protein
MRKEVRNNEAILDDMSQEEEIEQEESEWEELDREEQNKEDLLPTTTSGFTPIGKIRPKNFWTDHMKRITPPTEELTDRRRKLYQEKEQRFGEILEDYIEKQIGLGYSDDHQDQFLSCWSDIREHIIHLYETGISACYCGGTGSGKSHTLLEFIVLLCWREWEETVKDSTYPSPLDFIEKTVHFSYAVDLAEALSLKQKIPFAKYNLIDDLGVEVTTPYVQSRMDEYFETINRKGLNLVITSNISREDMAKTPIYQRIYSRMLAKVDFYELPLIDYRDPKNWNKI